MSNQVHRDLTASGARLRVVEQGEGDPILLLHGMFMDHSTWSGVMHRLENDFRLIAPDLPGFGESEKPPPRRFSYGVEALAGTIADLFGALRLGRAAVVGHDLGGAVALTLGVRHPELVSRLVLVSSLCHEAPRSIAHRIAGFPLVGNLFFKQFLGRPSFRAILGEQLVASGTPNRLQRIDAYYDKFNLPSARGSALATINATADTRPLVAQLDRLQARTLVVWGRRDPIYPAQLGQRLAREVRGAGFELLDSGHTPQEEQPDELARVIRRFLKAERPSSW